MSDYRDLVKRLRELAAQYRVELRNPSVVELLESAADKLEGDRTSHAGEAARLLTAFSDIRGAGAGLTVQELGVTAQAATAHATLALVEQHRIANKLRFAADTGGMWLSLRAELAEELGL